VTDVRIVLVSGSTRSASTNTAALRTAVTVAPAGVLAVLYDGLADLPAFSPDVDIDGAPPPVAALRADLAAAHAVLICTPEYAGTLPGSFKNLLDWTVGSGELYEKPVAWINVAAPGRGAGAIDTLQTVLRYVSADVIVDACVSVPVARDTVGPDGLVAGEAIRIRLGEVLATIAAYVRMGTWPRT
jgi:NAD(P)H-dependent FMN reductase